LLSRSLREHSRLHAGYDGSADRRLLFAITRQVFGVSGIADELADLATGGMREFGARSRRV